MPALIRCTPSQFNRFQYYLFICFLPVVIWFSLAVHASATLPAPAFLPTMDHVGIVVHDADHEASRLKEQFGAHITHKETVHFLDVKYKGRILSYDAYFVFADMGNVKIELIQPNPKIPSPYLDILNRHGDYTHHLCFLVPSIQPRLERLKSSSPQMKILVRARTDMGGEMVYIDGVIPGTLVELATPL